MPSPTPDEQAIARAAAQLTAVGQTVEVLALTADAALLATLRDALGDQRPLCHVTTREDAVEQLMSGRIGVIVIDANAIRDEAALFCERLRSQFPDAILIVAGDTDVQTQLIKQITAGDVYRFLHVPVSPARARQFLEAGLRRHLEGRTFTPAEIASVTRSPARVMYISGGIAVLLALAVGVVAYFLTGPDTPEPEVTIEAAKPEPAPPVPKPEPQQEVTSTPVVTPVTASPPEAADTGLVPASSAAAPDPNVALLANAEAAFAAGQLVTPAGGSAADLYLQVLESDAANRTAHEGIDRIVDQLLGRAESALLEERIDDAAREIEAARRLRPNNVRVAFVSAQLVKERERQLVAQAREAAAAGKHARARAMLDRAIAAQKPPSPVLLAARRELDEVRVDDNVGNLLTLANQRIKQDRLIEPENDSALSYIEAALATDPKNVEAQQALRALADQLAAQARVAATEGNAARAERLLAQAQSMKGDRTLLRAAQRELATLKQTIAHRQEIERTAGLLQQRIAERRFDAPERDSALHYWQALRTLDASNVALKPAALAIGTGLVEAGREALDRDDLQGAGKALEQARTLGYAGTDFSGLEREVAARLERAAFLANVVPASKLETTRMVQPRYPADAERAGTEGWVDIEFTVATDGSVKDVTVTGAQPTGVFEDAALRALSQWKYKPVLRNGTAVEQRARLRVSFQVPD